MPKSYPRTARSHAGVRLPKLFSAIARIEPRSTTWVLKAAFGRGSTLRTSHGARPFRGRIHEQDPVVLRHGGGVLDTGLERCLHVDSLGRLVQQCFDEADREPVVAAPRVAVPEDQAAAAHSFVPLAISLPRAS